MTTQQFNPTEFCKKLPKKTGIYRMLNSEGDILYIGKAVNLKSRVSSYFNSKQSHSVKTRAMVKKINQIEISFCESEIEALILEQNLIKQFKPRYNINLKDNKSYPYLLLTTSENYPAIKYRRNIKRVHKKDQLFGPYPSSDELKRGISLINKIFRLRDCTNTEFKNRTRACLKHQIGRCSAPCVAIISQEDYLQDVKSAVLFLQNKSLNVLNDLTNRMNIASERLDFEQAGLIRDQIRSLKSLNQVNVEGNTENIDLVVFISKQGFTLAHILTIRNGKIGLDFNYYFDDKNRDENDMNNENFETSFLNQYYLSDLQDYPNQIYLLKKPQKYDLLERAIFQKNGKKIEFKEVKRGFIKVSFKHATSNAEKIINRYAEKKSSYSQQIEGLKQIAHLENLERFECYDVSHTFGTKTTGSMVVFNNEGAKKSDYRLFNLGNHNGDDIKAMDELLTRRLKHQDWALPDLWLIDGGMSQFNQAKKILIEQGLIEKIKLISVSKGKTRKAGFENLIIQETQGVKEKYLNPGDKALHLIQYIRDESHRFAITHHRKRRIKAQKSVLDLIPGIGQAKTKSLLLHFSDVNSIKKAGIDEIMMVQGINLKLAKTIYDFFHSKDG